MYALLFKLVKRMINIYIYIYSITNMNVIDIPKKKNLINHYYLKSDFENIFINYKLYFMLVYYYIRQIIINTFYKINKWFL